jgi:hypothetical protein
MSGAPSGETRRPELLQFSSVNLLLALARGYSNISLNKYIPFAKIPRVNAFDISPLDYFDLVFFDNFGLHGEKQSENIYFTLPANCCSSIFRNFSILSWLTA